MSNALYLEKHEACVLLSEEELTNKLIETVQSLKLNNKINKIGNKAHTLFNHNASKNIAEFILKNIKC